MAAPDLRITLAQLDQAWEDKAANLRNFEAALAPVADTHLILLPELFHTGFTMNGEAFAEPVNDSPALHWLRRLAASKGAACYTSFIAQDGEYRHNRGVFVHPDGTVDTYDKRKTFSLAGESNVYRAGTREQIVAFRGWRLNLQICYDLRFPEIVRNGLRDDGTPRYDALLYVANWPARRAAHWTTLLRARAIENQCCVVGVNRIGTDGNGLTYAGDSAVYDALGLELAQLGATAKVQTVTLSRAALDETRQRLPFLADADCRSFGR